jgi:hypothetical protein
MDLEQLLSWLLPVGVLPKCSAKAKGALVYGFVWPPTPRVSDDVIAGEKKR